MTERDEFHARRRRGIGGSDVAAILGVPAFRTAYEVWLEKVGRAQPGDAAPVTRVGHLLEDAIMLWGMRHARAVSVGGETALVDNARPWVRGHADGFLTFDDGRIEGADAKVHVYTDHDDKALAHELQCRWYMAIADCERWHLLSCSIPRSLPVDLTIALAEAPDAESRLEALLSVRRCDLTRRVIERDREVEDVMIARCGAWWERYVVADREPPVDGSEGARRELRDRHATDDGSYVQDDDMRELVLEYETVKAAERDAKKRKDVLAQQIQQRIGDHLGAKGEWGCVRWSRFSRRRVDWDALRALRPDVADVIDQFTTQSPTGRLYTTMETV